MAGLVEVQSKNLYLPHTKLTPTQLLIMDFGALIQAIGYVAAYLSIIGFILVFFLGWITFVVKMTHNYVLQGIIILLPCVVVMIILKYHAIVSS